MNLPYTLTAHSVETVALTIGHPGMCDWTTYCKASEEGRCRAILSFQYRTSYDLPDRRKTCIEGRVCKIYRSFFGPRLVSPLSRYMFSCLYSARYVGSFVSFIRGSLISVRKREYSRSKVKATFMHLPDIAGKHPHSEVSPTCETNTLLLTGKTLLEICAVRPREQSAGRCAPRRLPHLHLGPPRTRRRKHQIRQGVREEP